MLSGRRGEFDGQGQQEMYALGFEGDGEVECSTARDRALRRDASVGLAARASSRTHDCQVVCARHELHRGDDRGERAAKEQNSATNAQSLESELLCQVSSEHAVLSNLRVGRPKSTPLRRSGRRRSLFCRLVLYCCIVDTAYILLAVMLLSPVSKGSIYTLQVDERGRRLDCI